MYKVGVYQCVRAVFWGVHISLHYRHPPRQTHLLAMDTFYLLLPWVSVTLATKLLGLGLN